MSKWFLLALLLTPGVAFAQGQSFPEMCPGTSQELQASLQLLANPPWTGKDACFWPEGVTKRLSDKLVQKEGCACSKKRA